jgi:predicted PhzF superfamily epimerase YddE/YHI9
LFDQRRKTGMKIPIYQVDAFTSEVFSGNPAAVCMLDTWIDDRQLQSIAAENNLSETAFLVRNNDGFDIRWFTPTTEVALCGQLTVAKRGDLLEMDFPSRPAHTRTPPVGLKEALRVVPKEILGSAEDLLVVLDSEKAVRGVQPDFSELDRVECRGTIITARGDRSDFVSRFFAPRVGVPEDPVTGSAHCVLIPYWADALHKNDLHAFQVSKRGGELFCVFMGERVKISGKAALYMEGTIMI